MWVGWKAKNSSSVRPVCSRAKQVLEGDVFQCFHVLCVCVCVCFSQRGWTLLVAFSRERVMLANLLHASNSTMRWPVAVVTVAAAKTGLPSGTCSSFAFS